MRLEMSKRAKDSVVLLRVGGELSAARLEAFLSHCPPGHDSSAQGGDRSIEPDLAFVHWYAFVPDDQDPIDTALGCPVFGKKDFPTGFGNMCLVQQILPASLQRCLTMALVPVGRL